MSDFSKHLYYDPSIPHCLRWISNRANNKIKANSPAGSLAKGNRYFTVSFCGKSLLNHRVVWMLHFGEILEDLLIDHIDGDCLNNSIENLRLVTMKVNKRNQRKSIKNRSGQTGVHEDDSRFKAEWVDLEGNKKTKSYSKLLYGKEGAFLLACEYRINKIKELNSQGDTYSDRHGI